MILTGNSTTGCIYHFHLPKLPAASNHLQLLGCSEPYLYALKGLYARDYSCSNNTQCNLWLVS